MWMKMQIKGLLNVIALYNVVAFLMILPDVDDYRFDLYLHSLNYKSN